MTEENVEVVTETPEEARLRAELLRVQEEKGALRAEVAKLKGHGPGTYDVAVVVFARLEAEDYRDAENIAGKALLQLIRDHAERQPETGTMALYAKHGPRTFGPVKIAKVDGLTSGAYESGVTPQPNSKHYRFWDLTPEQLEEMNQEAAGA